jgi:hypothetical protein
MRYSFLLQREASFRSSSRRLACIYSVIHAALPLPGFACPGRKNISSLLASKGSVSRFPCLLLNLHPLVAMGTQINILPEDSNTELKLYRI